MALVYWGEVDAASDMTMATVTNTPGSEFRAALIDLLQDVAAGVIEDNPTIIAAAEAAVVNALSGALYRGDLPANTDLNTFGGNDKNGAWRISPTDGHTNGPGIGSSGVLEVIRQPGTSGALSVLQRVTDSSASWWREAIDYGQGSWGAWQKIITSAELNARVGGLVDELALTTDAELNTRVAGLAAELSLLVGVSETDVTRSSRTDVPIVFTDKTPQTLYPSVYPAVYPPVTWTAGVRRSANVPVLRADGTLSPGVIPTVAPGVLTGLKVRAVDGGPVVLEVRADGHTYVEGAVVTTGGGSGGAAVRRVVVLPVLGQSNNVAYGHPVVPFFDHESSRIWRSPWSGRTDLIPAPMPLTGGPAAALSPSHVLAREIVANDPECAVVLVPVAVGGTGLVADTAQGKWEVGYTGPNQPLYANAVDKTTQAVDLARAKWGVEPTVLTTWLQGEQDGYANVPRATYEAALDTLINDWRTRFHGMFLIAGIVPGYTPVHGRPAITLALQDTPRRTLGTAYVPGVENGGGAAGPDDNIHYGREAVEIIGREWFKAIPRASNNTADSVTSSPLMVTATRWNDTVTVAWSPPYCRVSSYEVQSSTDGTTWADVPVAEPAATSLTFTSTVPVKVRVRANGTETSNWTAPVNTTGG